MVSVEELRRGVGRFSQREMVIGGQGHTADPVQPGQARHGMAWSGHSQSIPLSPRPSLEGPQCPLPPVCRAPSPSAATSSTPPIHHLSTLAHCNGVPPVQCPRVPRPSPSAGILDTKCSGNRIGTSERCSNCAMQHVAQYFSCRPQTWPVPPVQPGPQARTTKFPPTRPPPHPQHTTHTPLTLPHTHTHRPKARAHHLTQIEVESEEKVRVGHIQWRTMRPSGWCAALEGMQDHVRQYLSVSLEFLLLLLLLLLPPGLALGGFPAVPTQGNR